MLKAARLALQVLSEAGPRQVLRWGEAPPVLVFTDGACEDDGALTTHGAVLMDPATGVQEFFGDRVPDHLVQRWKGQGLKQLVFFAELLPVAVAKATWAHVLRNRLCIFFLDNEAARACLIRSFTPVVNATSILMDVECRLRVTLQMTHLGLSSVDMPIFSEWSSLFMPASLEDGGW